MMYDVTRDVVNDLWPLCRGGEASDASRKLVDAFCAEDPGFAATLRAAARSLGMMPALTLSPDAERRLIDEASARARRQLLVTGGGIALGGLILLVALVGALIVLGRAL